MPETLSSIAFELNKHPEEAIAGEFEDTVRLPYKAVLSETLKDGAKVARLQEMIAARKGLAVAYIHPLHDIQSLGSLESQIGNHIRAQRADQQASRYLAGVKLNLERSLQLARSLIKELKDKKPVVIFEEVSAIPVLQAYYQNLNLDNNLIIVPTFNDSGLPTGLFQDASSYPTTLREGLFDAQTLDSITSQAAAGLHVLGLKSFVLAGQQLMARVDGRRTYTREQFTDTLQQFEEQLITLTACVPIAAGYLEEHGFTTRYSSLTAPLTKSDFPAHSNVTKLRQSNKPKAGPIFP